MECSVIINVTLKGKSIDTYVLAKALVVIGRDPGADIFLDNTGVSRQHATIDISSGSLLLRDLASANGTLLNGERVDCSELKDGDVVRVGRFDLEIRVPHLIDGQRRTESRLPPPPGATLETH